MATDSDLVEQLPVTAAVLVSAIKPTGGFRGHPGQYRFALAAALTQDALLQRHIALDGVYDAVVQPGPGSEHSQVIATFFPINPGQSLEHTVGGLCPGAGNVSEVARASAVLRQQLLDDGHLTAHRNGFTGLTKYRVGNTDWTRRVGSGIASALTDPAAATNLDHAAAAAFAGARMLKTLPIGWSKAECKARAAEILSTDPVAHATQKVLATSTIVAAMTAALFAPH